MSLENKALVRRFYEEIDKGNVEAMDELVAENYVDHSPPPFPGLASGSEGVKQSITLFWTATPGHHRIARRQSRDASHRLRRARGRPSRHSKDRQQARNDRDGHTSHRTRQACGEMGNQGRARLSSATRGLSKSLIRRSRFDLTRRN
jgi:hypothetical protein